MKLACRLGWHNWNKWEYYGKLNVFYIDVSTHNPDHSYKKYSRECFDCGKVKLKKIKE